MLPLLRPISLRRLLEHRLRSGMTIAGVALGVAVLVAVVLVNRGILGSFSESLDQISGRVHLEVRGGDTGLPEELLDSVRGVPGVRAASVAIQRSLDVAVPLAEGTSSAVAAEQGSDSLAILAVNFTEDQRVLELLYNLSPEQVAKKPGKEPNAAAPTADDFDDPLAALDVPRQIVVSELFARRQNKNKGETVALLTPDGEAPFTLFAITPTTGPQKAFGGNLALMDYMDAQEVFGLQGRVDRIDICVDDPQRKGRVEEVAAAVRNKLGDAYTVESPSKRQQRQQTLLRTFHLALSVGAGVSLIVGMFLIYHTLSISVAQRRQEIGILRAAGATRRQIVQLFTLEGAAVGLLGSALGVAIGRVLATFMLEQATGSISEVYVKVRATDVHLDALVVVGALVTGVVSACLASLWPAWQASQLSPVETIRTVAFDFHTTPSLRWGPREFAAVGAFALAPIVMHGPPIGGFPYFGLASLFCVVLGATLLARWFLLLSHRLLGPAATALFGLEGRLAADNVSRGATKASVTVASLMVGLSMVLASSIMTHSIQHSIDTWIEQAVPADLFVTSGSSKGGIQNQPVRPELAEAIAQVPGVRAVDRVRLRNIDYQNTQILLLALDVELRFSQHSKFWPFVSTLGGVQEVVRRMRAGEGVVIAQTLAHRYGLQTGGQLALQTPGGQKSFLILGTITDYSSDQGAVFLDRSLYTRVWQDELVDTFEPYLQPGADAQEVRRAILASHGRKYRLHVLTNSEFRAEIQAMIGRIFRVTRALELVTIAISLLSVVNTLLTAVLDRMREIGVLRAIGLLRRQLSRMIVVESLCLSLVGATVGLGVGVVNGWLVLNAVNRQDTGWDVATKVPWETTGIYLAALVVVGALAALYPARVAGRVAVVDALGYE